MKFSRINFYKEPNGDWFADLPDYISQGGTKADTQMVMGADALLDYISEGSNYVTLVTSDEYNEGYAYLKQTSLGLDEGGAYYDVHNVFDNDDYTFNIWICDVTKYVLGGFPISIYFTKLT